MNVHDLEMILNEENVSEIAVTSALFVTLKHCLPCLIDIKNYSLLNRLLRVTAFIIRFIENCRGVEKKDELDVEEKEGALQRWIKVEQADYFSDVLDA